jgi:hypothetical protein
MQYLTPIGEYVIPIAALILAFVVMYWDDLRIAVRLINRLIQWMRA